MSLDRASSREAERGRRHEPRTLHAEGLKEMTRPSDPGVRVSFRHHACPPARRARSRRAADARRALGRIVFAVAVGGCGGGATELLDTARLEEVQNNPSHARELYEEVVRRHPGTPEARTAEDRLRALTATPAPRTSAQD
jgi:hypothetical protein